MPDKLTYQWTRDGKPIKHATRSKYKQTNADRGRTIKVTVKAERAGHRTGAYTLRFSGGSTGRS
jgi:5'-nucleotidase